MIKVLSKEEKLKKEEILRLKSNSESMPDVIKIWNEIKLIQDAQKVEFKDYPYGLTIDFYNRHQNHLSSLLIEKFEQLDFIEKMIDAQNTKYKMEN
jgi:hypothetical protein